MSIGVRIGGAWKDAAPYVRVAGEWKLVTQAYVKVAGAWQELLVTRGPSSLIDRTAGTNIGNMTSVGGLAAAFDGVTNQAQASSASRGGQPSSGFGAIGKTMAAPTAIESITIFGPNNQGYINNENPTVTIALYGKVGAAPSSWTDGSLLGSIVFTDTADESAGRQISSSDVDTHWDHVWVRISGQQNNDRNINCAELQFYGWQ